MVGSKTAVDSTPAASKEVQQMTELIMIATFLFLLSCLFYCCRRQTTADRLLFLAYATLILCNIIKLAELRAV